MQLNIALGLDADHQTMLKSVQDLSVSRRIVFALWLKYTERLPSQTKLSKSLFVSKSCLQELINDLEKGKS